MRAPFRIFAASFKCFIRNVAHKDVFFLGLLRLDVGVVHGVSPLTPPNRFNSSQLGGKRTTVEQPLI
jgi:hypothetical protein